MDILLEKEKIRVRMRERLKAHSKAERDKKSRVIHKPMRDIGVDEVFAALKEVVAG